MKLFDFNDPRHIAILREELSRAKRIIKEHNRRTIVESLPNDADLYYRGIMHMLRDKENRFANTAEVCVWLKGEINGTDDDLKTLADELYQYATENPSSMMDLRVAVGNKLQKRNPDTGIRTSVNPYDSPSHVSKGHLGSRYTGD